MVGIDAAAVSATATASCSAVARVKQIPSLLSMIGAALEISLRKNLFSNTFFLSANL